MDLLKMDYINSLGQLYVRFLGDTYWWPLFDVEVQTGLLRIDVCGMIQVSHIDDIAEFKDDWGRFYDAEEFYVEEDNSEDDY